MRGSLPHVEIELPDGSEVEIDGDRIRVNPRQALMPYPVPVPNYPDPLRPMPYQPTITWGDDTAGGITIRGISTSSPHPRND